MKRYVNLALLLATLVLCGCVSATYRNGDKSVTYNDLFKKASDVQVDWGDVSIQIGNISSEITAEDIAAYLRVMSAVAPVK